MTDTGESVTSINRRLDAGSWPTVLGLLRSGAVMFRPSGMRDYYTWPAHPGAGFVEGHCLTASGVKRLAGLGVLISSGVDRYSLNPDWSEPDPELVAENGGPDAQLDLFGGAA